jgi:hypothetical protein
MIQAEFDNNALSTYTLDSDGDPVPGSRQVVASGFALMAGVVIDPITGDALISQLLKPHLEVVRGFAAPPSTATPRIWGDLNCNGSADPVDALDELVPLAAQTSAAVGACPGIGAPVQISGHSKLWGDWDCSGTVMPKDVLPILEFDAQLDISPVSDCPITGSTVQVTSY